MPRHEGQYVDQDGGRHSTTFEGLTDEDLDTDLSEIYEGWKWDDPEEDEEDDA